MIGFLRGILIQKLPPALLLDVHGVGYEVDAPMSTFFNLPEIGTEVTLLTHLSVREDAHSLYGFLTDSERSLFRALIKVNGIGAKLALGILSGLSAEEFCRCVEQQDAQRLVKLPGVGKKTADRLIIELRDRLPKWGGSDPKGTSSPSRAPANPKDEALSALVALGFRLQDAQALLKTIDDSENRTSEEIIRLALKSAVR